VKTFALNHRLATRASTFFPPYSLMAIQKPLIKKFSLDGASRESWECMLKSKTVTREDCDLKSFPFDGAAISTFTPCCLPISVHFQLFHIRSFLALIVNRKQ
jgi:hypothetical protein